MCSKTLFVHVCTVFQCNLPFKIQPYATHLLRKNKNYTQVQQLTSLFDKFCRPNFTSKLHKKKKNGKRSHDWLKSAIILTKIITVFGYVVTWNVKTYVTHPLECRMSQEWLKWCSDPPQPPPLNSTWLFGLRKFSGQTLLVRGGGGVWHTIPPLYYQHNTTYKSQHLASYLCHIMSNVLQTFTIKLNFIRQSKWGVTTQY